MGRSFIYLHTSWVFMIGLDDTGIDCIILLGTQVRSGKCRISSIFMNMCAPQLFITWPIWTDQRNHGRICISHRQSNRQEKTALSKLRNGYSPLNISKPWGMPSPTFHSNISFTFACPPSQYRHRSYTATVLPLTILTAYIYVNSYQRNNNHYHLSLLFIILTLCFEIDCVSRL